MKRTMRMHARSHRRRRPDLDVMEERSLLSALSGVDVRDAILVAPVYLVSARQPVANHVADPDEGASSGPGAVDPDETGSLPRAPVSGPAFDELAAESAIPVPLVGSNGESLGDSNDESVSPQPSPSETPPVLDPPGGPPIGVGPPANVSVSRLSVGKVDQIEAGRLGHGLTLAGPGTGRRLLLLPPPRSRFSEHQAPRRAGPITGFLPLGGSDLAKAVDRFLGPLAGDVAGHGNRPGPALSKWLLVVVVAALEWLRRRLSCREDRRQEAFVRGPASTTSSHGFPELLGLRTAELP